MMTSESIVPPDGRARFDSGAIWRLVSASGCLGTEIDVVFSLFPVYPSRGGGINYEGDSWLD
jgi:hypothetical protein